MRHRMGAKLDSRLPEFANLVPGQALHTLEPAGGLTNIGRWEENRGRIPVAVQYGECVRMKILIAVIEGDPNQLGGIVVSGVLFREIGGLHVLESFGDTYRPVAVFVQELDLLGEHRGCGAGSKVRMPVGIPGVRNTVVHQNRDSGLLRAQALERMEEVESREAIGAK